MFHKTKVCTAAILAIGGSLAVVALPASAQEQGQTQRVEITGSAIKRVNAEGPAPVEVVTRRDIARTGATTVNELIRSLPTIDVFDQGELASNSPAGSGTANVAMRGLSSSNLLVLLNGRRLPVNAIYDSSGAGAAVDINTIPVSAIERIEILKDGGSAIYGADAVAGVVNVITKTDYQGIEARAGFGVSSEGDGKETQAGLVYGFGDLTKDRFNVLVGLDYFKRDPIYRADRELTRSVDFRRFGARDGRSSFSPFGNVVDPNSGAAVGLTYRPCPPDQLGANGICRYDFNASLLTAYNGADRLSGIVLGSFQITPDIRGFAEVMLSRTKDHFEAHPVPDYFVMPIIDEAQRPYEILNADGTGTNQIYIAGRFMQGGPRITDRKSDLVSTAVGVEGATGGFDWKVTAGYGRSKVTNSDRNYYDLDAWLAATSGGLLDPTSGNNDPAFVESLKVTPSRVGKAEIGYVNAQIGGDAFSLPAGPVRWAAGVSFNRETLQDTPDELTQAGNVVGSIQQSAVDASRNFQGVFGELQIPILKTLEGQLAVRYDRYPNASQTSPKVALKWTPVPQFAVRGSYTESFRAPVLKQLYGAQEQGAITVTDAEDCTRLGVALNPDGTCLVNAFQVNGSNPNLTPETGKTYNLGFVFEAGQNFNASLDFWRIHKEDDISSPTVSTAIEQGLFTREGARINIFTNLQNIAERQNSGVDLDARLRFPGTTVGNLTFRNLLTYYHEQKSRLSANDDWNDYNGTYALPRWRNTFQATSEFGPWAVTGAIRTVGGFWDTDEPFPIAEGTRKVGTHEELDLQVQYTGLKGWTLNGGIKNVLDRVPPFSQTNATNNAYTQMGFAELYSVRGRFFYVTANYAFR